VKSRQVCIFGLAVAVLLLWMVFRERRKKLERMQAEQSSNFQGRY